VCGTVRGHNDAGWPPPLIFGGAFLCLSSFPAMRLATAHNANCGNATFGGPRDPMTPTQNHGQSAPLSHASVADDIQESIIAYAAYDVLDEPHTGVWLRVPPLLFPFFTPALHADGVSAIRSYPLIRYSNTSSRARLTMKIRRITKPRIPISLIFLARQFHNFLPSEMNFFRRSFQSEAREVRSTQRRRATTTENGT